MSNPIKKIDSFYTNRILNASDFSLSGYSKRLNKNGTPILGVEKLRQEFNVCIRNWSFYMLSMTRTKHDNFEPKNLQMILTINNFEFDEQLNKSNGK